MSEQQTAVAAAKAALAEARARLAEAERAGRPCLCGCGGIPRGAKARYLPGHDARHLAASRGGKPGLWVPVASGAAWVAA